VQIRYKLHSPPQTSSAEKTIRMNLHFPLRAKSVCFMPDALVALTFRPSLRCPRICQAWNWKFFCFFA
jgi:hypothetical protein